MNKSQWDQLQFQPDRFIDEPGYRFGKYVDPVKPRASLRESPEGRMVLANRSLPDMAGSIHERLSDTAPFVAWDGEGITPEYGLPQNYVLFGDSQGFVLKGESLDTIDCLDTIIASERYNPKAIHVGFAFKYDAEMILKDLPIRSWYVLKDKGSVRFEGYNITYHPGRLFRVTQKTDSRTVSATVYDVWGFFQASFIKALQTWLDPEDLEAIDTIEKGKAARGQFTYDQIDDFIRPYWETELDLLVRLMQRLRERMDNASICPREWHGAGAVASTVYRSHKTRLHQSRSEHDAHIRDSDLVTELPEEVNRAARYAYAGGRFELFKMGHTDRKVYQYDINSAYPNGIAKLPSLKGSTWRNEIAPRFDAKLFGLWHITYNHWDANAMYSVGALPFRDYRGRVSFPQYVTGWYWTPEAALIANSDTTIISEAWICDHNGEYPFEWVRDLYADRRARKAVGDPSEKAQKLALNSLYGKMAQRLGWKPGNPLPRFHQLEWAGFVTSYTRMMLYHAMKLAGNDLIAVETDAVFSTKPLDLDTGTGLGQWEVTEHAWITYLQSGTYWSDHGAKYRGFDRDSINHDIAMQWLRRGDFSKPIVGTTTRFVGSGTGLGTPLHRCWITESREMWPGSTGKRVHVPEICSTCHRGELATDVMHSLACTVKGGTSFPHALPWRGDGAPIEWQELYEIEGWDAFE